MSQPDGTGRSAAVWARHGRACYRLARQVTGQDAAAEQAVGQAFASLAASHDASRPEPGETRSWLLAATHRQAADAARRQPSSQRRQRVGTTRHALDPPASPDPVPGRATALHAALGALPPPIRQTLALAWAGGYTCQEIAQLTGDTPAAVLARLRQALHILHAHLPAPAAAQARRTPPPGAALHTA